MSQPQDHSPFSPINEARAGSEPALGELLDTYRSYLKLLAQMQLSGRLQAKLDSSDLVQETCLYAYKHFGGFRGDNEGQLMAWLRKILADRTGKHVRRYMTGKRDMNLEQRLEQDLTNSSRVLEDVVAADLTTPSEKAIRREQSVRLADALEQLPPHYREVMILHHLQGLPLKEVANQMGRTYDGVRKLWARSMVTLRPLLKDKHDWCRIKSRSWSRSMRQRWITKGPSEC